MQTLFFIFLPRIKLKHQKYPSYAQTKATVTIVKETAIQRRPIEKSPEHDKGYIRSLFLWSFNV